MLGTSAGGSGFVVSTAFVRVGVGDSCLVMVGVDDGFLGSMRVDARVFTRGLGGQDGFRLMFGVGVDVVFMVTAVFCWGFVGFLV